MAHRGAVYVAMLAWVGCGFFVGHAGRGGSVPRRLRAMASVVATGGGRVMQGIQGPCLTTSVLAERLAGRGDRI